MAFQPLVINAAQFCDGLSHFDLTPPDAIVNIVDNAVTARAKKITVDIVSEIGADDNGGRGKVREYVVTDDGMGMDEYGIKNALSLGSAAVQTASGTSPGLGLGLKSAAFTQGDVLEVVSSTGDAPFAKYQVNLRHVRGRGVYGAERLELTENDKALVETRLQGRGTIVRITEIRQSNCFSVSATVDEVHRQTSELFSPDRGAQIEVLTS